MQGVVLCRRQIEADTVVTHGQFKAIFDNPQFNANFSCLGMTQGVGEGFLGDAEAGRFDERVEAGQGRRCVEDNGRALRQAVALDQRN